MRQIHTAGAACAAKESMATAAAASVMLATAADGEASGGQEDVQHDMQQRMSMPAEVRDKERRKHVKSYLHRDGDFTAGW